MQDFSDSPARALPLLQGVMLGREIHIKIESSEKVVYRHPELPIDREPANGIDEARMAAAAAGVDGKAP